MQQLVQEFPTELPPGTDPPLLSSLTGRLNEVMELTLENLRLLCPNCNSQTDTFAGRNVKRKKMDDQ